MGVALVRRQNNAITVRVNCNRPTGIRNDRVQLRMYKWKDIEVKFPGCDWGYEGRGQNYPALRRIKRQFCIIVTEGRTAPFLVLGGVKRFAAEVYSRFCPLPVEAWLSLTLTRSDSSSELDNEITSSFGLRKAESLNASRGCCIDGGSAGIDAGNVGSAPLGGKG